MKSLNRALFWLLLVGSAVATADLRAEVEFIPSPFKTVDQMRQALDAADVRIMLPLGYALVSEGGQLGDRLGLIENRVYAIRAGGGDRYLELAIVAGVGNSYDFALLGRGATEGEGNADLVEVQRGFRRLLEKNRAAIKGETELAYEMFRLGHIEADRALALVKALGYHTVEFSLSNKSKDGEPIFDVEEEKGKDLPWVVKVVNASKTSLMEEDPDGARRTTTTRSKGDEGAPQLGGTHLHSATTGAPEERLLLVYDRNEPEELERLINLLQAQIDVPAQQIVIEALVIEVNTDNLRDLGVEFRGSQKNASLGFESGDSGTGLTTFLFSRDGFTDFIDFRGKLEALQEMGNAEVLSSPSVLVLNDRQARIQVGRQIPVAKTTATTSAVTKGIEYFPVGIVLNLRPRINRENTEVTMQIETIISSISVESAARLERSTSEVEFSPIVDNRMVETYVRVADGTPFIIGGLLSTDRQSTRAGVPMLGTLPVLGRLFSRERLETDQREVIVVITPHIVPLEANSFSYLIPKDSDLFDRFDTQLFRNAYRVRDDDVWDLKFVQQSPVLTDLLERVRAEASEDVMLQRQAPFQSLLQGKIPGEEVLVRRMLSEIVANLDFPREVQLDQVFFFTPPADEHKGQKFSDDLTLGDILPKALAQPENAVMLTYDAVPGKQQAFSLPLATVRDTAVAPNRMEDLLWDMNRYDERGRALEWTIVLSNQKDIERLRQALVLKRVLQLNKNMPLTLQGFQPGVQILFPTREDVRSRYHLIDRQVAQLFFETKYPYQIAERIFNETVRQANASLGGDGR